MRKLISFFYILISLSSGLTVFAGSAPGTGIYQSIHDLNNGPDGTGVTLSVPGFVKDSGERLCAFCHTPHHAVAVTDAGANSADTLPLWSHAVTIVNYSPYMSTTFTPKGGKTMSADPLTGPSRLCMSCHDGLTAVDSYYGLLNNHIMTPLVSPPYPGMPVIASNGSKSHPIGFAMTDVIPGYPGATSPDTNILPLNNTSTYLTGSGYLGPTIISRLAFETIMTCSTCHDVHNSLNKISYQAGTQNYLILAPQTNSYLCFSCHTSTSGVSGTAHNW
jgi:Doubled CXXCH motif (Paired_CXXCH_1)